MVNVDKRQKSIVGYCSMSAIELAETFFWFQLEDP